MRSSESSMESTFIAHTLYRQVYYKEYKMASFLSSIKSC